jgi:CRISPR-associated protein Csb1
MRCPKESSLIDFPRARVLTSNARKDVGTAAAQSQARTSNGDSSPKGDAKNGFGHVPFHRDEYTGNLTAYFNIDLAQIRGMRLGTEAETLLIGLSLFKILRLLRDGLRLRTACDLKVAGLAATQPETFSIPELTVIEEELPGWIATCKSRFADPPKTRVVFEA